ncbi:MAG: hypothetical protein JXR73_20530 [Candidatus Omnitrophica bacterium]|nr:hypothetical protein [Candidatus Omnitrophota bacterium]
MKRFSYQLIPLILAAAVNAQTLLIDDFETYIDDYDIELNWIYSKAGGPDGMFAYLDMDKAPQGENCLWLDVDMPEKWWHNIFRKEIPEAPLDLADYQNVQFQFFGDETIPLLPDGILGLSFTVFLYDSQGRALNFSLPGEYVSTSAWQQVTISLDAFNQEEWDAGYGTANPDANPADITALALMCVGNDVNQVATFWVDDIQFVSEQASSSINGVILADGQPLEGVTVFAVNQTTINQTITDAAGAYSFADLHQGRQYRILPLAKNYVFDPPAASLTLFSDAYTQDFTASVSPYNSLELESLADQFDEGGLNPAIVYRGAREWEKEEEAIGDSRPIIDVTQDKSFTVNFPDAEEGEAVMYGIEPNTLDGADSPAYALEVGGFYSWDMLAFGQDSDANYFVEVDAFCDVRFDAPENMFDRVSLGLHCSIYDPDKLSLDSYGQNNIYRSSGGYAISFETDSGDIIARKYAPNNSKAYVVSRLEGFAEDYARITLDDSGWHRFRIEYLNGQITFYVDGEQVAQVEDDEYPFGPAGLHYRACYSDSLTDMAYMNHARFDNLKTGPTSETGVQDWMLN